MNNSAPLTRFISGKTISQTKKDAKAAFKMAKTIDKRAKYHEFLKNQAIIENRGLNVSFEDNLLLAEAVTSPINFTKNNPEKLSKVVDLYWKARIQKSLTIVSCDHEEQQYLDPIFSQLSDYIYAQKHSLKKLVSFETWIAKRKALDEVYDNDASMWEELGQAAWDNE